MASPIRMTGLTSGLDTESIVTALTSGYKSKVDKYKQQQTKVSWKQDAWKDINKKVYSLYTSLDSMRFSANWKLQKATSSNTNKATVTSNGKAFTGNQDLTIQQLATTASLTGGKLGSGITGSSTLYDAGYTDTDGKSGTIYVNGKSFTVNGSDTINSFVSNLQSSGVNASYDSSQHRIYVSAKKSGKDGDFSITGDVTGNEMLKALGLVTADPDADSIKASYAQYDLDELMTGITKDTTTGVPTLTDGALTTDNTATKTSVEDQLQQNIKDFIAKYQTTQTSIDNNKSSYENIADGLTYMQAKTDISDAASKYDTDTFKINEENLKKYVGDVAATSVWYNDTEYKYDSDKDLYISTTDSNSALKKETSGSYTSMTLSGDTYKVSDGAAEGGVKTDDVHNSDWYIRNSDLGKAIAAGADMKDADDTTIINKAKSLWSAQEFVTKYEDDTTEKIPADDNTATDGLYTKKEVRELIANATSADDQQKLKAKLNQALTANNNAVDSGNKTLDTYSVVKDLATKKDGYTNSDIEDLAQKIENAWKSQASSLDTKQTDKDKAAQKVNGVNGKLTLGGVEYDDLSSNNVTINGLTIQMLGTTTGDEKITITTQTDSQGIYDKIKDFFSTYNDVINEITDNFNAKSSKGYDPLTDDQKSEMSDTQVEKWEKKAKAGLLRNDSTLNSIMNTITNTMLGSYTINGKKYSLANFGIMTKGILNAATNRQYEYHIDGDEDDESVASNSDKLMAAINEDPDSVIDFMQQLTNDLYTNLDKKMKRTSLKSAYTIYNDKEMASEYSSYTSLIKQWEDRLSTMEESYYTKFSKMESTLSKLQSSTSSLTNSLSR